MNLKITVWALALALVGCGGSGGDAEEGHGDHHAGGEHEGGDEHGELPPAVHNFHEVLAPIWHAEEGDTRRDLACDLDSRHDLESAADDVEAMSVPEGVDENAWHGAADDLAADVDLVVEACEAGGDEVEAALTELHEAFHAIMELVGPEREAAPAPAEEPEHEAEPAEGAEGGDAAEEPAE